METSKKEGRFFRSFFNFRMLVYMFLIYDDIISLL